MDKDQHIAELQQEIQSLRLEVAKLKDVKIVPTKTERPFIKVEVSGQYRSSTLEIDTLLCFYEGTGHDSGMIVYNALADRLKYSQKVEWMSYKEETEDFLAVEKKIASVRSVVLLLTEGSLQLSSAVFIVQCCVTYNIPVINLHDLTSCPFPNPIQQPQQIQDSGIFNDKAITYVHNYIDKVMEQLSKQIDHLLTRVNFCLCYSYDTPTTLVNQVVSQFQSAKHHRLIMKSDSDPHIETYFPHIAHTIDSANALIIILDQKLDCLKSLAQCLQIAYNFERHVYFIGSPNPELNSLLQSLNISPHKISSLQWETDGLTVDYNCYGFTWINAPIKISDIVFNCQLSSGKWYYEVHIQSPNQAHLGWANKNFDISIEDSGVGEDEHSYGYDGSRRRILPMKPYGELWDADDVIGCLIDFDSQEISYSRNGKHLGVAFSNFQKDELAYCPAITTDKHTLIGINFLSGLMRYMPPEYKPVIEGIPLQYVDANSIRKILLSESNFDNYNKKIPRTRAFLSHKRSSAQGVAGRIWQEFKSEYHIFLDSEAQFDLHDLKQIAQYTGLFIFILSEGIFDSFWCLEELRSAIKYKRRILVLLDWQFKMPKVFPPELQDIATFFSTADTVLYMAEFFSECMKEIRKRLGDSDEIVAEMLDCLIPISKQCVIDDSFGEYGKTLKFCEPLPISIRNLFPYLERYYECSSIINVNSFEEAEDLPIVPITDEDIEALALALPKLKLLDIFVMSSLFTDQALNILNRLEPNLQVLKLWKNCETLTDLAMEHLSKMKQLKVLHLDGFVQLTDRGLIALSNVNLTKLTITKDVKVTDAGIAALPSCIRVLTLHSAGIGSIGVQEFVKKAVKLEVIKLLQAKLDDDAVITLMKHCQTIEDIYIPSTCDLTDKCMTVVEIPGSLKTITVSESCVLEVPSSVTLLFGNKL